MKSAPTLRSIARAAGVSHETVSRALRHDSRVSAATGERIRSLADQLGYRTNPLVSALMRTRFGFNVRRTTANVVFLKPTWGRRDWWSKSPFREQADATLSRLRDLGFDASELSVPEQDLLSPRLARILRARGVRGVVIGSMPPATRTLALPWNDLAVVAFSLSIHEPLLDRVSSDVSSGLRLAMRELLARGYCRPGLAFSPAQDERREFLLSAAWHDLQQRNLPERNRIPSFCGAYDEALVTKWFSRHRPDAILSLDPSYLGLLRRLRLRIPEEAGFLWLEVVSSPAEVAGLFTDIPHSTHLAAELLAEKLMRNDFGIPRRRHTLLVQPDWREGLTLRPRISPAS